MACSASLMTLMTTYVHTLDNTEDIDAAELYYDSVCSTYYDTDKEIRVYIDNPNRNVSGR